MMFKRNSKDKIYIVPDDIMRTLLCFFAIIGLMTCFYLAIIFIDDSNQNHTACLNDADYYCKYPCRVY